MRGMPFNNSIMLAWGMGHPLSIRLVRTSGAWSNYQLPADRRQLAVKEDSF